MVSRLSLFCTTRLVVMLFALQHEAASPFAPAAARAAFCDGREEGKDLYLHSKKRVNQPSRKLLGNFPTHHNYFLGDGVTESYIEPL
jgi:hypothetical protein